MSIEHQPGPIQQGQVQHSEHSFNIKLLDHCLVFMVQVLQAKDIQNYQELTTQGIFIFTIHAKRRIRVNYQLRKQAMAAGKSLEETLAELSRIDMGDGQEFNPDKLLPLLLSPKICHTDEQMLKADFEFFKDICAQVDFSSLKQAYHEYSSISSNSEANLQNPAAGPNK